MAALKYASLGDIDFGKAADAFWHGLFPGSIQSVYEPSAEVCDFCEGMGLAALVRDT